MLSRLDRRDTQRFRRGAPGFMGITVLGALLVTGLVGGLGDRFYDPREARASMLEDIDQSVRGELLQQGFRPLEPDLAGAAVRRLADATRVELLASSSLFDLPLANGPVTGEPPTEPELSTAVAVVAEELARYPREFIERSGLRRVLLCRALAEGGRAIPSLPNFQRSLLLDVEATPEFLRRLIHHEVFHFADFADDEQVQDDPEWERENGAFFVYGPGGRYVRSPSAGATSGAPPGFVTPYATSALEEDKAETFAFMMVAPGAIGERARTDRVLQAKTQAVARQVLALSPAMDDGFWQRGGRRAP